MLCNVSVYWVDVCCPLYIMHSTLLGILWLYAKLIYVMNMINIIYWVVLLTILKLWLTFYQQIVTVFGDECEWSMEENGSYGAAGVLWDFRDVVWCFLLVLRMAVMKIDYVYGSKCESRRWHKDKHLIIIFTAPTARAGYDTRSIFLSRV